MNKNNLNTKKRYDLLDAYKLFASIGVISIHCIYQLSSNEWYKNIQFLTAMCVPYFFMVSGYFLWAKEYKINKQIHKIINLYLYTFILYNIIGLIKSHFNLINSISIQTILKIIFLNETPWNTALWYLPAILMLLLLDNFFFSKVTSKVNNMILTVSLLISLTIISCSHQGIFDFPLTNLYIQGIPFYLLGKQLNLLKERDLSKTAWTGIIISIFISYTLIFINKNYEFRFLIGTCLIIPIFIIGILYNKNNIIISTLAKGGRKLSTGIYIYHLIGLWITPGILKRCNYENLFFSFPVLTVLLTTIGIIIIDFIIKWFISFVKIKHGTHLHF